MAPDELKLKFLQFLTRQYYEIVPKKYKTFCVFNARLLHTVLSHYQFECELMPCQIWLSRADDSFALGFLDTKPMEGGWDGHVACCAGDYFIDASIYHFHEAVGIDLPDLVLIKKFDRPSHILGQYIVTNTDRIWWHEPPNGVDPTPPEENQADLLYYANQLIGHMNEILANTRNTVNV